MRQNKQTSAVVNNSMVVRKISSSLKYSQMKSFSGDHVGGGPLVLGFIDPRSLTRESILGALAMALPDYTTVAASSCEELLEMSEKPPGAPDLIIIHTRSAKFTDAQVQNTLALVRLHLPGALVVLLSDREDVEDVVRALDFGVRGYIPTSLGAEVAIAALRLVDAGGTFIPADVFRSAAVSSAIGTDYGARELTNDIALTPRELSVIKLLHEGRPNKLIAAELKMQESTVKVHVRNILKKFGVTNRTRAAFIAHQMLSRQSSTTIPPHWRNSNPQSVLIDHHTETVD